MRATNGQIPDPLAVKAVRSGSILFWTGLILVSGVPRILAAFLLPNAFGDAYTYLQVIEAMRAKMTDGTFSVKDLYGFWLPSYQFICAIISFVTGHSFYVTKLVSAICGTGVCLLVFRINFHLTAHLPLSLLAFTLVSLSPLHILYSSSALTDIPHALMVLASLSSALEKRWKTAAVFAAAAGSMRIESWMLIALLPALQFLLQRRLSLAACGILMASPLLWFYICWEATGNPLAYFEARNRYIVEYIAADPVVATFSFDRLLLDAKRLLISTNLAVLAGCLTAAWMIAGRLIRQNFGKASLSLFAVIAPSLLFFSNLCSLLYAYITGSQPIIWTRYGLLFFALGLPVLAWTFQTITAERPQYIKALSVAVLSVFILQTGYQIKEVVNGVSEESARKEIAGYLSQIHQSNPHIRIYCEDGIVQFLSGIPSEKFLNSSGLPADSTALLNRFSEDGVEYVVCTSWEISTLTKLLPELKDGTGNDIFQPVMHAGSKHSQLDLWVYRLRFTK